MKNLTLKNLYDSNEFSSRLYNSLRCTLANEYSFTTNESAASFTIGELVKLLEENGIGYRKRISRNMGLKSINELNDWIQSNMGIDYIEFELGSVTSPINRMKDETLKLIKLLMLGEVDSDAVKRRIITLSKLSSNL